MRHLPAEVAVDGLHRRARLGNQLLVVEHEAALLREARDEVLVGVAVVHEEVGPGAGRGRVVGEVG